MISDSANEINLTSTYKLKVKLYLLRSRDLKKSESKAEREAEHP